ncbi:hypothetical protein DFP72DRAFT_1069719 [Ephemerocybe angulata]|uniref:Uncharacterized protein n=1 Tax=Ephemerocybe angulata TaxID=980116 RepID=A0A8H6M517_9AGAR|nr:hypothetical protein DFP72DRAFT_1069719 [Tulosesus angulatus]
MPSPIPALVKPPAVVFKFRVGQVVELIADWEDDEFSTIRGRTVGTIETLVGMSDDWPGEPIYNILIVGHVYTGIPELALVSVPVKR